MNVPAERIAELLRPYMEGKPIYRVAEELGCNHQVLEEVMNGDRQFVPLVTVDKWCTRLERTDWLHVELADIYDRDEGMEQAKAETAAALKRAEEAEARARKWYGEVKRLRASRQRWREKYCRLRRETEPWRQAERYRARQERAA